MEDIWTFTKEELLPHWHYVVGYFSFVLFSQFLKVQLWNKKNAGRSKVLHYMRRTMAIHPPITGIILAQVPGVPGGWFAWFGIGVLASFSFHVVKQWFKKKYDVDLGAAIEEAVNPSMTPLPSVVKDTTKKTGS